MNHVRDDLNFSFYQPRSASLLSWNLCLALRIVLTPKAWKAMEDWSGSATNDDLDGFSQV